MSDLAFITTPINERVMGKTKTTVMIDGGEIGKERPTSSDAWAHVRKLLKLVFGSQSIMIIAIGLMTMAVLNGDVMRYFTNGAIINFNDLLASILPGFSYPLAMVVSAMILIGPLQYYVLNNMIEMIIVIVIVFLFTGFFLGRMFKHPLWAFISGFIVMASFIFSVLGIVSLIDYFATQAIGISVRDLIFGIMEGIFDAPIESLFIYTVLENGGLLGLCGAMWGSMFMPGRKNEDMVLSLECSDDGICKV